MPIVKSQAAIFCFRAQNVNCKVSQMIISLSTGPLLVRYMFRIEHSSDKERSRRLYKCMHADTNAVLQTTLYCDIDTINTLVLQEDLSICFTLYRWLLPREANIYKEIGECKQCGQHINKPPH